MKRRGFTFSEIMVVWCIIGVLAAILFPVFARARAKGLHYDCLRHLCNIGVALRVYAQDHYGQFPPANNDLWPLVPKALPDPRALVCPSAGRPIGTAPAGTIAPAPPAGTSDYVYWGGACDDDRPTFMIAGDDREERHNTGANYLWVDGHVKWLKHYTAEDWREVQRHPGSANLEGYQELQRLREMKPGYEPPEAPPADTGGGRI